ncbi:HIT family protein [Streptomyces sp. NBC_01171]|uniref:HIT family protein n=1 Tax=Streptomyces sp. NBC_01171 TaxID=2903757 RepID=UPI0038638FED|nr:HIT family protein [Streptomyces sp. NBC_01171]
MDLDAYVARARNGPCFICAYLDGHPDYRHEPVYEDDAHVAFLDRWPTLPGKLLVAPKAHIEHAVRDLGETAYTELMLVVRRVALAMEEILRPERTYLLSLGSRQGNAHLHWHIAGLPPGVPYERQQFHALMTENGVLNPTPDENSDMARRLRARLAARRGRT